MAWILGQWIYEKQEIRAVAGSCLYSGFIIKSTNGILVLATLVTNMDLFQNNNGCSELFLEGSNVLSDLRNLLPITMIPITYEGPFQLDCAIDSRA